VAAVAAAKVPRCAFEDDYARAGVGCSERGAEPCVAAADDSDIEKVRSIKWKV